MKCPECGAEMDEVEYYKKVNRWRPLTLNNVIIVGKWRVCPCGHEEKVR